MKFPEILERLEENNGGTFFVTDMDQKLQGSLSDGDLRRASFKYKENVYKSTAEKIMNQKPISWDQNSGPRDLRSLAEKKRIPGIDSEGRIKFLFFLL